MSRIPEIRGEGMDARATFYSGETKHYTVYEITRP